MMDRVLAPPLASGCPWSGFTPPNVDWCEEELCSWVVNPADTWSNLAYIVLGLWMWRAARSASAHPASGVSKTGLRLFGPAAIAVGLCSGIYHASYTYILQLLDFAGMYLFCFLIITLNARRLGWISEERQILIFLIGVTALTAVTPLVFETGVPIQGLVAVLIAAIGAQEWMLRGSTGPERWWFLAGLGTLGLAGVFSALDVSRIWCEPQNHWLQGHAIWHLLSAAALGLVYRFYTELGGGSSPKAEAQLSVG